MLLLYDRETSGNCYKIRLLLSFLDMPYESVPVGLKDGKNEIDSAYLNLNPRGQIPTLDDNGFVLWGSTAILAYLASRYDASRSWLPIEPAKSGEVMQWLELAQNEIFTGLFLARAVLRFGYAGDAASAQVSGYRALDVLERRLSGKNWLVGDRPTIADIACFPYVALSHEGEFKLLKYTGIQGWLERFKMLDGFVGMPGIR